MSLIIVIEEVEEYVLRSTLYSLIGILQGTYI